MLRCLILGALVGCASLPAHAQTGGCLPADGRSDALKQFVVEHVTAASGTPRAAVRDSLKLSTTTAGNVALIMDAQTCQHAGIALSSALQSGSTTPRLVWVIKSNDRYVVVDPTVRSGEFEIGAVFDRRMRFLSFFQ